jgi:SAM-dependent methyltransferase
VDPIKLVHSKTRHAYDLAAQRYHDLFHDEMNEKAYDRLLLDSFAGRLPRGARVCDAGCGPSAHIGRYLADKGLAVIGVDISDRCVEMARAANPQMRFVREDMLHLGFADEAFDGIVAYYAIIHTPKAAVGRFFREFHRVLKPDGRLLLAVKAGSTEGYAQELLGIQAEIYFSFFDENEISGYLEDAGFAAEFLERRNPYDFEIKNERIFAIGRKVIGKGAHQQ